MRTGVPLIDFSNLDVKVKTAYHWVRQTRVQYKKRGGYKKRTLTPDQIEIILTWFEADCQMTLKQAADRISQDFGKSVSTSTVGNYLDGHLMTFKKVHKMPLSLNSEENKSKRRDLCLKLAEHHRDGREIIFMDETNFNLFCKRTKGWARRGDRATMTLPNSKGPNLHLISGFTSTALVGFTTRRGSFKADDADEWLRQLLRDRAEDHDLSNVVIICDNAPCHSHFERVISEQEFSGTELLRLAPYSCMLNPIENIWSKVKNYVKTSLANPPVSFDMTLGEQRMRHLEQVVQIAVNQVTMQDCLRCYNHSLSLHPPALAMQDMQVGV